MIDILNTILDSIVFIVIGALASYYYYHRKRRALLGGFWGGAVIGILGAVIITVFSGTWFINLLTWLMKSKEIAGGVMVRVNLLSAFFGSFLFVYILNRINHDRPRD